MKGRETMKVYVLKKEADDYEPYPEIVDIFLDEDAAKLAKEGYKKEYEDKMQKCREFHLMLTEARPAWLEERDTLKPIGRRHRFMDRQLEAFKKLHEYDSWPRDYIYDIETWETV